AEEVLAQGVDVDVTLVEQALVLRQVADELDDRQEIGGHRGADRKRVVSHGGMLPPESERGDIGHARSDSWTRYACRHRLDAQHACPQGSGPMKLGEVRGTVARGAFKVLLG